MKKFKILICILLLFTSINVKAQNLEINSKYAVLYNMNDDKVIYELDRNKKISVASLTKIMTCLVAIENIDDLNKTIVLNNSTFTNLSGLSVAGFKVGQKVTYYDLLYGAMLPSGADAVQAIALNISGSLTSYVELMNEKAKELNLNNTHFVNVTGLDADNHYSTVEDIANLLKYALKNQELKKIFMTKKYTTSDNTLTFKSTLFKYSTKNDIDLSIIKGSKTGFTDDAGLCMASISDSNNVNYLLVTCGANTTDNKSYQIMDAIKLYGYYSNNYSYQKIVKKNQKLLTLKVKDSYTKEIIFKANKEISLYLKNDIDLSKLKYKYEGIKVLNYKNKKGDKLGTVMIYNENILLEKYDVILDKNIKSNIPDKIMIIIGSLLSCYIIILIIKDLFKK